jgi:hypothetical protein
MTMTASNGISEAADIAAILRTCHQWGWKNKHHWKGQQRSEGSLGITITNRGLAIEEMDHLDPLNAVR